MSGSNGLTRYLYNSYTVEKLETVLTCSGTSACMFAVIGTVEVFLENGHTQVNVLCAECMFTYFPQMFRDAFRRMPSIKVTTFNPSQIYDDSLDVLLRTGAIDASIPTVMIVESFVVPSCDVIDFRAISYFRENFSGGFILIVNNTMLTEVALNPFMYGADVVVQSLDKWHSGNIVTSIGEISSNFERAGNQTPCTVAGILSIVKRLGVRCSPHDHDIVHRHTENVRFKLSTVHSASKIIAKYLSECGNVQNVRCMDHLGRGTASKYLKDRTLGPGIVYFTLKLSRNAHNISIVQKYLDAMCDECEFIDNKQHNSYGGELSQLNIVDYADILTEPTNITLKFSAGYGRFTDEVDSIDVILSYFKENLSSIFDADNTSGIFYRK